MKLPSGESLLYQALLVVGGAVIAAAVVGQLPWLRAWMRAQWGDDIKR